MNNNTEESKSMPYVKIVEQPCSRTRYRYECENKILGNLVGATSVFSRKTYPAIEIVNSKAPALIVISCVTRNPPYRPHPHHIFGKSKEISQGILCRKVSANHSIISFRNLGIQCVKRKDMVKSLALREQLKIDPFKTGFCHKTKFDTLDMGCVRLCFQVFLESKVNGMFKIPLAPVVTNPIYDKKTSSSLIVWWLSHYSAPVTGGTVMCLLCEKLTKWDVEIRFFCEKTGWEMLAELEPPEYHKQVAVIFKAPKYIDQNIEEPVEVKIEIKQPSNGETSEAIPFLYIPVEFELQDGFKIKRQKCGDTPKSLVTRNLLRESEKYLRNPNERDIHALQAQSRNQMLMNLESGAMQKYRSIIKPITVDEPLISLDPEPIDKSLTVTKQFTTNLPRNRTIPVTMNAMAGIAGQPHFGNSCQKAVSTSYHNAITNKPINEATNTMDIEQLLFEDFHGPQLEQNVAQLDAFLNSFINENLRE